MNSDVHGVKPPWHKDLLTGSERKIESHGGIGEYGGGKDGTTADAASEMLTKPKAAEAKTGCIPMVEVEVEDAVFEAGAG